jgi:phosphonoacetate hydrolase
VSGIDQESLEVNGRTYAVPRDPVVVVCIDGSEPAYHQTAVAEGRMPFLESVTRTGSVLLGDSAMPSFTNPNNVSIATGVPPAEHGVSGNYFYDRDTGVEVMMNDASFLRTPTIFAEFERAGADVVVVTAKDKLRRLLGKGLTRGICFSAEHADTVSIDEHGIDDALGLVGMAKPSVYSAELSEFAMAAGVGLLETRRPLLTYVSLTDYVQHKYAPDEEPALDFYAMLDGYFARIDALGAVLVVTADHGMNAKSAADGSPSVVYVQDVLDRALGSGSAHVVLPITDPYTVHHGALGSFAFVYATDDAAVEKIAGVLGGVDGIDDVVVGEEVCRRFELPADRIGDVALVASRNVALGTSPQQHDLTQLDRPLRSHGGLTEQRVPIIVNRPIHSLPAGHRLRNFDAYWLAANFALPPSSHPSS